MIEQVDWNFCCKVADTMECDRQEGITAQLYLGGMLNYLGLGTDRYAGKKDVAAAQALFSGFSGVTGLVSALISGLAS